MLVIISPLFNDGGRGIEVGGGEFMAGRENCYFDSGVFAKLEAGVR